MPYRSLPILIVDGDARVRRTFIEHFDEHGLLGIEADTCEEAISIIASRAVNMIIIDWDPQNVDTPQIASYLRSADPLLPIVAHGDEGNLDVQMSAFSCGVDDFWVKPFPLDIATAKCRAMLRRAMAVSLTEAPLQLGETTIDLRKRLVLRNDRPIKLNEKEFGIIRTLALEHGAPVRRETLIARVWGYDALPVTRTVDNYIVSLRRKIENDPSDPRFLLTVGGIGYRLNV